MNKYMIILCLFLAVIARVSSAEEKSSHSLGWALAIADRVRDRELPGAQLDEILGFVDETGGITESDNTNEWTFHYYVEQDEDYSTLGVTVYNDSSTYSYDPGSAYNVQIPSYESAETWVQKADGAVGKINFAYRSVQVFADYDDIYANVENTVYVYYNTAEGDNVAYVIMDADTNEILLVELNP